MYESKSEGMIEMAYYFISLVCKYCIVCKSSDAWNTWMNFNTVSHNAMPSNWLSISISYWFKTFFFFALIIMACFTHHICSAPCKNTVQTLYKSVYECNALQFRSSVELEFSNSEWFKQFTATLWGLRFRLVEFLSCKWDFMMIKTVIV